MKVNKKAIHCNCEINIYIGSNTVEHILGGVTKSKINAMFRTNSKHSYWQKL